jgi:hypothetical protein
VRQEIDPPTAIKESLGNAPADTPAPRRAFMQGPRSGVERALQPSQQDVGPGDYPVRGWRGGHPPLARVRRAMLFLWEARPLHHPTRPLLSGRDIRALLNPCLPRRDTTLEEILRPMEVRHRQRQAAIDSAYRQQQLNE